LSASAQLLVCLATDADDDWVSFKDAHSKAAEKVLGFREFIRSDWISDRTRSLAEKKRTARLGGDMDKDLNKQCKKSARQDKHAWAEEKATQGEAKLASCEMKVCLLGV